jgi:hypothetical protein
MAFTRPQTVVCIYIYIYIYVWVGGCVYHCKGAVSLIISFKIKLLSLSLLVREGCMRRRKNEREREREREVDIDQY